MKHFALVLILAVTSAIAQADGWELSVQKDWVVTDTLDSWILTGAANTTPNYSVFGFSDCQQFGGSYPSSAPYSTGFDSIWSNTIEFDVRGTIPTGQTSVTISAYRHEALNSSGGSAWEGWHYKTGATFSDEQVRKIEFKIWDLGIIPGAG